MFAGSLTKSLVKNTPSTVALISSKDFLKSKGLFSINVADRDLVILLVLYSEKLYWRKR